MDREDVANWLLVNMHTYSKQDTAITRTKTKAAIFCNNLMLLYKILDKQTPLMKNDFQFFTNPAITVTKVQTDWPGRLAVGNLPTWHTGDYLLVLVKLLGNSTQIWNIDDVKWHQSWLVHDVFSKSVQFMDVMHVLLASDLQVILQYFSLGNFYADQQDFTNTVKVNANKPSE